MESDAEGRAGPFDAGANWDRPRVLAKIEEGGACWGEGEARELMLCWPISEAAVLGAIWMFSCITQQHVNQQ